MTYSTVVVSPSIYHCQQWRFSSHSQPSVTFWAIRWYKLFNTVLYFLDYRKPQGLFFHAIPMRLYFTRHSSRLHQTCKHPESLCSLQILWISRNRIRTYECEDQNLVPYRLAIRLFEDHTVPRVERGTSGEWIQMITVSSMIPCSMEKDTYLDFTKHVPCIYYNDFGLQKPTL